MDMDNTIKAISKIVSEYIASNHGVIKEYDEPTKDKVRELLSQHNPLEVTFIIVRIEQNANDLHELLKDGNLTKSERHEVKLMRILCDEMHELIRSLNLSII